MADPPRYTQRMLMRARLGKGGYLHHDQIVAGEKVIGLKVTHCEKRGGGKTVTYMLGNGEALFPADAAPKFTSAKAFIAAYEATQKEAASG
jgi:hypothetical protein